MNTRTLSTLSLTIVGKRGEQSSTGGSGDGGDLRGHKGKNTYASLKSFQEKNSVESEGVPLMNTRTPSTLSLPIVGKRGEQSSTGGSGDGGDLEGHKGKNRYASLKSLQEEIAVGSEDVPLMITRTPSTLSLRIAGKRREQSSTEGSDDGGDFEEDKGNDRYESIKTIQKKIVVESEDIPLTNTRTLSTLSLPVFDEGNEHSSAEGSGNGGDLKGHKGKNTYASLKSVQEKIAVGSEGVSLMNTRTPSTLSLPIVGKRGEQSSTGESRDGGDLEGHKGKNRYASLKSFQEKIAVGNEDVPLMRTRPPSARSLRIAGKRREQSSTEGSDDGGDFEEDKLNDGYESIKTLQEKIVVESEDIPLTNTRTLSILSLPVFHEGNEQSSAEGSGDGGDLEGHRGQNRYASLKSFQDKIVIGSEDVPLTNTRSLSTLSLTIFDEGNEQSSVKGSGMLCRSQQELSPSKKSKSKIRKAKRTTSRVEGDGTNRSKCEVM